jgi:cobalamin biosynthesis Co2+ chelatase CbiK
MSFSEESKSLAIRIIQENRKSYGVGITANELAKIWQTTRKTNSKVHLDTVRTLIGNIREDLGEYSVITINGTYIVPGNDDEKLVREFVASRVKYEGTHIRRTKKTLYVASRTLDNEDFELAADIFGSGERVLEHGLRKLR